MPDGPMPSGIGLLATLWRTLRRGTSDFDEATGIESAQNALGRAGEAVQNVGEGAVDAFAGRNPRVREAVQFGVTKSADSIWNSLTPEVQEVLRQGAQTYSVADSVLPNLINTINNPDRDALRVLAELGQFRPGRENQFDQFDPEFGYADLPGSNPALGFLGDMAFDPLDRVLGPLAAGAGLLTAAHKARRAAQAAGSLAGDAAGLVPPPGQNVSRFVGGASDDEANDIFHHIADEGGEFLGEVQEGVLTEPRMEHIAHAMLREYDRIGEQIASGALNAEGITRASEKLDEIAAAIHEVLPAVRNGERVMVSDLLSALHGTSLTDGEIRGAMTMFFGRGVSDSMDDLRLRQADSGETIMNDARLGSRGQIRASDDEIGEAIQFMRDRLARNLDDEVRDIPTGRFGEPVGPMGGVVGRAVADVGEPLPDDVIATIESELSNASTLEEALNMLEIFESGGWITFDQRAAIVRGMDGGLPTVPMAGAATGSRNVRAVPHESQPDHYGVYVDGELRGFLTKKLIDDLYPSSRYNVIYDTGGDGFTRAVDSDGVEYENFGPVTPDEKAALEDRIADGVPNPERIRPLGQVLANTLITSDHYQNDIGNVFLAHLSDDDYIRVQQAAERYMASGDPVDHDELLLLLDDMDLTETGQRQFFDALHKLHPDDIGPAPSGDVLMPDETDIRDIEGLRGPDGPGPYDPNVEDAWEAIGPFFTRTLNKMARLLTDMDDVEDWNGLDVLDSFMVESDVGREGLESLLIQAEPTWTPAQRKEWLARLDEGLGGFRPVEKPVGLSEEEMLAGAGLSRSRVPETQWPDVLFLADSRDELPGLFSGSVQTIFRADNIDYREAMEAHLAGRLDEFLADAGLDAERIAEVAPEFEDATLKLHRRYGDLASEDFTDADVLRSAGLESAPDLQFDESQIDNVDDLMQELLGLRDQQEPDETFSSFLTRLSGGGGENKVTWEDMLDEAGLSREGGIAGSDDAAGGGPPRVGDADPVSAGGDEEFGLRAFDFDPQSSSKGVFREAEQALIDAIDAPERFDAEAAEQIAQNLIAEGFRDPALARDFGGLFSRVRTQEEVETLLDWIDVARGDGGRYLDRHSFNRLVPVVRRWQLRLGGGE